MIGNKIALYLHLVWSTWDRFPLIAPDIERRLHRCIESEAQKLGCSVLAVNGTSDHVHIVVTLPSTVTIAALVKQMKGVSSHLANDILSPSVQFKWQGGYSAFSVSRWDVEQIVEYVKRQQEHHSEGGLLPEWEMEASDADGHPSAR